MKKFVERAMEKVSRMNEESIRGILRVLSDENDRLDAILDSMMDGIIVCDSQHIPLLINKAAERLLPLSQNEILDLPLWKSITDEELSKFVRKYLEGEETILNREFALDKKDGTTILSISLSPLVKDKKIQGTLVRTVDTTEKRRNEARLHQAESLASLTTLAAGVAHEIKNPLGSISIQVQLLRKALGKNTEKNVTRYLDTVTEEIDRLNDIVVDFLFAVRPIEIVPINDDINDLVSTITDFMHIEVENAKINIILDLDNKLPLVPFDKRYMKQAFLNLIKNAVAAMPEGGTLSFVTKVKDDHIIIKISDTGIGIEHDKISKIFEPYYTTKSNGTGLGLTLTYKIIREHGGDINVKSKIGIGTTFIISLPIPQKDYRMIDENSLYNNLSEKSGDK